MASGDRAGDAEEKLGKKEPRPWPPRFPGLLLPAGSLPVLTCAAPTQRSRVTEQVNEQCKEKDGSFN